ncbi:aKG-HExxH-type peptide beta-hydroxylase [Streptomyces sp. NPDC056549]|uniref:aKG-HExxH-type peptide beta-hydroxylase n=1 Tax=Streptomyces sp. NPDC056549 TaxID=3345864 RepID=UPI0036AD73C3
MMFADSQLLFSPESLGTTPCARAAAASKRSLARATLDSATAILDGLANGGCGGLEQAYIAVERLRRRLAIGDATAKTVEPVFYEWYFRCIALIRRREFDALLDHAHRLPAISAVPLARSGDLDVRTGEPLTVTVPESGEFLLSERVVGGFPSAGLRPGAAAIATDGTTVHVQQLGRPDLELALPELVDSATVAVPGAPITFWQASPALDRVVADYQNDLAQIHLDTRPFQVRSPEDLQGGSAGGYVERFAAGLDLIKNCWPDLYEETCALTDHFTLIRGTPFIGGSAIGCLGVSFFKLLPEWSDICFADHIVHEAAHQRLHVEFELEPALANGGFFGSASPIRRDPRPLYGVLHATFVFMRLSLFLERVIEIEYSLEAERRLHRHVLGLYSGIEQLERHGEWNPRGAQLFSEMRVVADRLRKRIPSPDPELYTRLGPDYEPVRALTTAYYD